MNAQEPYAPMPAYTSYAADDIHGPQPGSGGAVASSSRRGTKRRKESAILDNEGTSSRRGTSATVQALGSDDLRYSMTVGSGSGVNPEDIHPHLDFTLFQHQTVAEYLEINNSVPDFGHGNVNSVWDVNAKATDPRLLYTNVPAPIVAMLPGAGMGAGANASAALGRSSQANGKRNSGSLPHDSREGRANKRRSTATSMVAAAIEESITMAEEEERKRRDQQAGDGGPQELVDGKGVESTAQSAEQGDGAAAAAQGDSLKAEQDETEEQGDNPNDPPAPRRSGRKPLPAGTSLAVTYRNTRSSPSPTPSVSSEDELDPYVPILADLDMAKKIFAERAGLHWRDALAAGGGATVQGPGVNPAFAGQVMMGGTGGMMREGEVVAEFLYSTRVKSKSLKVAAHNLHAGDHLPARSGSFARRT